MGALDSLVRANRSQWPQYYDVIEAQFGATATLLDIGNVNHKPDAATWAGKKFSASGLSPVWTPNEALSAWDTPFDLTLPSNWQGLAPVLTFNGTDEEADTPNAAYWQMESNAYSIGIWVKPDQISTNAVILGRDNRTTGSTEREFLLEMDGGAPVYQFFSLDDSAGGFIRRLWGTAPVANQWVLLVVTVDGADVETGIHVYTNGALDDGAADEASFTAQEAKTVVTQLGYYIPTGGGVADLWSGGIAGGPWSPFFVQAAVTAAQIANYYGDMRLGLGI